MVIVSVLAFSAFVVLSPEAIFAGSIAIRAIFPNLHIAFWAFIVAFIVKPSFALETVCAVICS